MYVRKQGNNTGHCKGQYPKTIEIREMEGGGRIADKRITHPSKELISILRLGCV